MEYWWYRNGNYRSRFGPGSGTGWDRNRRRPLPMGDNKSKGTLLKLDALGTKSIKY